MLWAWHGKKCNNQSNINTDNHKNHAIDYPNQIQEMINIISITIAIFSGVIFLSCCLGSFRAKDLFAKAQFIKNLGLYALNLMILSFAINSQDPAIFAKSFIAIILNILAINLFIDLIVEVANKEKIEPDAKKKSLIKEATANK